MAHSTRRTYQVSILVYLRFCKQFNLPSFPVSEMTLRYFCTHISQSGSHWTVMVYLSGIRLLHYLLTAIRRSSACKPLQTHPITPTLLVTLKTQLYQSDLTSRDWAMFWAAFTLAFMGFYVRVSILRHGHATTIQDILIVVQYSD